MKALEDGSFEFEAKVKLIIDPGKLAFHQVWATFKDEEGRKCTIMHPVGFHPVALSVDGAGFAWVSLDEQSFVREALRVLAEYQDALKPAQKQEEA